MKPYTDQYKRGNSYSLIYVQIRTIIKNAKIYKLIVSNNG